MGKLAVVDGIEHFLVPGATGKPGEWGAGDNVAIHLTANRGPWKCFHCEEEFTSFGAAADHFGADQSRRAGCLVDRVALEEGGKPQRGRGLLMALREIEDERDNLRRQVESLEYLEENFATLEESLKIRFGTSDAETIWDRFDNEQFRARHAVKLLDAAGIPFDSVPQGTPGHISADG